MVQKSRKNKRRQASFCLVPGIGVEAQIGQPPFVLDDSPNYESRLAEQSLLEQPSNLSEHLSTDSEVSLVTREEEQQNKWLVSKGREGRNCEEHGVTVLDYKAKVNCAVDLNLCCRPKPEEGLIEESCSRKAGQSVGRQQQCAASKTTLQKELVSCLIEKRSSSLTEVRPHEKDTAPKKSGTRSLLEHEQKISSCLEKEKKLKKKHKSALAKSELHADLKNLIERDGSSAAESQEATGKSNKCSVSKPRVLQKSWYLRERSRASQPEQKSFRNQDKRQREKRSLSFKLQAQSLSLQQCKGKHMKLDSSCKLQPSSLDSEDCTGKQIIVKPSSVPHVPCGNTVERRESVVKSHRFSLANLKLVEHQEEEQALQQKYKSRCAELTQRKSGEALESVVYLEESEKRIIARGAKHNRMVTRALLKSKMCENDNEELDWKQEKYVAMEIPCCRQGTLEKRMGQIVESAPTEGPLIARVTDRSEKQTNGKDDIVPSPELKIKIKTSRKQKTEASNTPNEKLPETDLSTSQDCSIPELLVQSACHHIIKLDETEHEVPVSCCLGRKATIRCYDSSSFPVTSSKCPQLLDIKITENTVGKDPLSVYQGDKPRCLTELNELTCRGIKNPVVRLLDCRYIKALVNPTSHQTIQSNKLHCEFLHVALCHRKALSPNSGMGPNDVNSSSKIVQLGRTLSQTNILVGGEMCQNRKTSPRFQNGKKRFTESMQCSEFKKNRKRIKMSESLEESTVQEVLSNMDLHHGCELKIDKNATAGSSVITEELDCNATVSLSSLDVPGSLLKKHAQKHVTLSGDEQESNTHVDPYDVKLELVKEYSVESKTVEPHTDLSNTEEEDSVVEMLAGEKIANCSNNTASDMQGGKMAPKEKAISKTGKNLQFSCQRIVPFSGKNIWPRESCARTSLQFCKNHASGSKFLSGTDAFSNFGQIKLHKQLIDTSKEPVNKVMGCKVELSVKSSTAETQLDIHKAFSDIGNKDGIFSTDTERPKQSKLTKNEKKYRMTLSSPVKYVKNESIAKGNVSIDIGNSMLVDNSKNKTKALVPQQKTAVPQVMKTLSIRKLSDFKIPLLKDKRVNRKERNCYSPLNVVDNKAAAKEDRSKRSSSDVNFEHLFHSEQVNGVTVAAVEDHADQFNDRAPESLSSDNNNNLATSLESNLESALKDVSNSLSTGCTKKSTESSIVSSEIDKDNWSDPLAQTKDKFCADVLKAYEDDALVIDVIQDDPELFENTDEVQVTSLKEHFTDDNYSITISSQEKLELNSESSPLPRKISELGPRERPILAHDTLGSAMDVSVSLIEVDEIKSDFLSETSLTRGSKELFEDGQLTESEDLVKRSDSDGKYTFSEETIAVKEIANIQETEKIKNTECRHVSIDQQVEVPLRPVTPVAAPWQGAVAIPWMNDFRFSWKGPLMLSSYPNSCESWKVERNRVSQTYLGLNVPRGYCRLYFNTLNGCGRQKCWYGHVPEAGDEKLCNEILKKYISIGEVVLLRRAVQIFTDYFKDVTRGMHLDPQMLNNLLIALLQYCLLKELFHILHTCLLIKVLPAVDVLLKVFEHVASMKLKEAVPELIDISFKLIDDGMVLEYEHFGCISKFLSQLQVSSQEIIAFMSRFQPRLFYKANICDFGSAIAEFQHCKEKGDWTKLGIVYVSVKRGCEHFDDLERYLLYIANILTDAAKEEGPGVPFCEFAAAVNAELQQNEADKNLLGRMGISVLYSYYRLQQWQKARKILDTLHALQIRFTYLKGLLGPERLAPRCQIVNVAVEVFLNSGSLDGAVWILKESEWVINTLTWPCDRMDVLNRHNLLCKIASEYITKNCFREAFEVLRNLPGLHTSCDSLDVSQYSLLFNKLLGASSKSECLGISSTVVDFMLAKKIPVDFQLLRTCITALGRSCLWLKARTCYRSALALGCYPPLQGNLYRKLLQIPSYITEVEMLLAIEIFLVSNASNIQSPGASNQILQVVLKRCEGNNVQNKDDYQSAAGRLIQATQLASPKLFLKHLTVNITQEQVYSLDHECVLKWLKENMKWAGKVWLFQ